MKRELNYETSSLRVSNLVETKPSEYSLNYIVEWCYVEVLSMMMIMFELFLALC